MVNNYTLITLFKYKTKILHNVNETIQGETRQLQSIGLTIENLIGLHCEIRSLNYLKPESLLQQSCLSYEIPVLNLQLRNNHTKLSHQNVCTITQQISHGIFITENLNNDPIYA